jgi:diguanylate cyclase (GGDEF)-like protein
MSKQQSGDPQTIIRVESVVSLFRRAKIVFASSLFLGVLILLFLVYIPFSNVLEESLITNFEQIAMANYHVLDGSIKRSVEGANSLSSRTMIKNAAEDFQKGLITFEELADYTQPKYEDGAKALEHLASAERFIGSRRVASYQTNYQLSNLIIPEQFFYEDGNSYSKLYLTDKNLLYLYRSPVSGQDGEVAYDILIFDLTIIVEKLSTPTLTTRLLDESAYQELSASGQLIKTDGEDTLTSAGSRSSGELSLELAFQRFKNEQVSPVVMMIDVDILKNINDSYGHVVGDAVLRGVTSAVYHVIRENDEFFRWGGDEFIAIFSGISQNEAINLAERILNAIFELQIDSGIDGQFVAPTISIGVTVFLPSDTHYEDAVKRADRALYQSKMMGRNQVNALWEN